VNPSPALRRASLLATGASALLQVAGFLVFALLARRLTPADLGAYRLLAVLQSLTALLGALGTPAALLYALGKARTGEERARAAAAGLACMLAAALLVGALTAGAAALAGLLLRSAPLSHSVGLAGALGFFSAGALYAPPLLVGLGRARGYLLFSAVQLLGALVFTGLLIQTSRTLAAALTAALLAAGQGFGIALSLFVRAARPWPAGASWRASVAEALRYGWPLGAGSTLYTLGYQADHLVANLLFGPARYSLYAGGAWALPAGALMQQGQGQALLPAMAGRHQAGEPDAFWEAWREHARPALAAAAFLFWGLFASAADLLHVALGAGFAASVPVFRIYALTLPLRMLLVGLPLRAAGQTRWEIRASLLLLAVNLLAGTLLGPRLGLPGPALGVLIALAAWALYALRVTSRQLQLSPGALIPFAGAARSLAATALAAGAASLLAGNFVPGPSAARLATFWALYGGVSTLAWRTWIRLRRGGGKWSLP
jgi:O-antigen/teichoic acid export membrane protein